MIEKNEKIYNVIKERILFCQYVPGEIINEKKLSEEFGVSRTPIRENLAKLEWEKLVKIVPRAGAIVASIEFNQIREVYQIRSFLEGLIGRLAAERITDAHLKQLEIIKEQCVKLFKGGTKQDLIKIDIKFRDILASAAANTTLKEISDFLYNITLRFWYTIMEDGDFAESVKLQIDEIDKAILKLKKGNPEEVERLRCGAISDYVEKIKQKF